MSTIWTQTMSMVRRRLPLIVAIAMTCGWAEARAGYVNVDLSAYTNENFRLSPYQTVAALPVGGTAITVGTTPFTLATYAGQAGTTGVVQTGDFGGSQSAPGSVSIAVNISGATEVDTLINSTFGSLNAVSGQVEFFGTGGAFASFSLVQGTNIRDYNVGSLFNNTIAAGTNTVTFPTGSTSNATRLDEQIFILPPSFKGQTLTTIELVNETTSLFSGAPFLAAVTASVVPEPSSAALVGIAATIGLGAAAIRRKIANLARANSKDAPRNLGG